MKLAAALLLVLASGCGVRPIDRNTTEAQDEDGILFKLVLEDLRRWEEFRTYPSATELVVWDTTEGLSAFITTGQLSSELADRPTVSMELYNNLKARNSRKTTLNAIEVTGVRMGSPKESRGGAYVSFWLPAYSEDGLTALVRFAFGPTPHGACGTCFLEMKGRVWQVLWRKLSYYA
jgi:hypothetical protein